MSVVCGDCIRYYHVMSSYVFYTLYLYIYTYLYVYICSLYYHFCLVNKSCVMGWLWHQLDNMQIICTSLQTDNHASTS